MKITTANSGCKFGTLPINQIFILQASIAAVFLFLIINICVIVIGLSTLTVIFTNKFERKKMALKTDLTSFELFIVVLKAFVCAILITAGLLVVINFILYLSVDLSMS